jgi:hypothetical protein
LSTYAGPIPRDVVPSFFAPRSRSSELVDEHVVRHDEVRPVADDQVVAAEARRAETIELDDQRWGVDDDAVAEQVPRRRMEDARGDQVELELAVRVDHVCPALFPPP